MTPPFFSFLLLSLFFLCFFFFSFSCLFIPTTPCTNIVKFWPCCGFAGVIETVLTLRWSFAAPFVKLIMVENDRGEGEVKEEGRKRRGEGGTKDQGWKKRMKGRKGMIILIVIMRVMIWEIERMNKWGMGNGDPYRNLWCLVREKGLKGQPTPQRRVHISSWLQGECLEWSRVVCCVYGE